MHLNYIVIHNIAIHVICNRCKAVLPVIDHASALLMNLNVFGLKVNSRGQQMAEATV